MMEKLQLALLPSPTYLGMYLYTPGTLPQLQYSRRPRCTYVQYVTETKSPLELVSPSLLYRRLPTRSGLQAGMLE